MLYGFDKTLSVWDEKGHFYDHCLLKITFDCVYENISITLHYHVQVSNGKWTLHDSTVLPSTCLSGFYGIRHVAHWYLEWRLDNVC